MEINELISVLISLRASSKDCFTDDGTDEIFREDVEAIDQIIPILMALEQNGIKNAADIDAVLNDGQLNTTVQFYRTIPLKLIDRKDYSAKKAKRFTINGTNQNVWIPNKHLLNDGTIRKGENLDYIFRFARNQLTYAGITWEIPGIRPLDDSAPERPERIIGEKYLLNVPENCRYQTDENFDFCICEKCKFLEKKESRFLSVRCRKNKRGVFPDNFECAYLAWCLRIQEIKGE